MPDPAGPGLARRQATGLGLLFGAIYFIQGVSEPTEGLLAQPVRSLLKGWGAGDGRIAGFVALMALPWSLKPLFGLLTDFVPILGSRRRSYLVLAGGLAALGSLALVLTPLRPGDDGILLALLIVPTAAVALADVAADALMVEAGRPLGLTGRFQAIQWGAMYAATVLTGHLGGYLSAHRLPRVGFAVCGALSAVGLILALAFVREPDPDRPRPSLKATLATLAEAARSRVVVTVGLFLFLWNFNPFSQTVLYLHMTRGLGLGEEFYGTTVAHLAYASIVASGLYGLLARRLPFRLLIHASIALGIAATLAYGFLEGERSALAVTWAVGLSYMTATLIGLDLAARACPIGAAGTVFAAIMALENLANSGSTALGGYLYGRWSATLGRPAAFRLLVGLGAATTAACWLVAPWLVLEGRDLSQRRGGKTESARREGSPG